MPREAIVCVDDESIILMTLKKELSQYFRDRFEYGIALNAVDAEALIDELMGEGVKVILIISDWLMPGIKGDEFIKKMYKKYPTIKCILLTGHATNDVIESVKEEANLIDCFFKPWNKQQLFSCIEEAVSI
jgi:DNA-binding NtrC family response regulator